MKRFTETHKWENRWFRRLPMEEKLLWYWLLDHCDNAGVIDPDLELAAFQIGTGSAFDTLPDSLTDRLSTLENGKLWIRNFIDFQCSGKLSRGCPAHKPIFASIERNRIPYPAAASCRVSSTLQEEEEDKEQVGERSREKNKGSAKEGSPSSDESDRQLAERLVAACPRPDLTIKAIAAATKCLTRHRGTIEFPEILETVQQSTAAVREWPEDERITYAPEAERYFAEDLWRKSAESWKSRRQARQAANEPVRPKLSKGSGRKFILLDDLDAPPDDKLDKPHDHGF